MNSLKLLAACCITAVAIGCSSDCGDPSPQDSVQQFFSGEIAGTWKTVAVYEYDGDHVEVGCDLPQQPEQDVLFTFFENNTFTIQHNCDEDILFSEGTYTTNGHVLTLVMNNGELQEIAHMVHTDEAAGNTDFIAFRFFGIGNQGMLSGYRLEVQKI